MSVRTVLKFLRLFLFLGVLMFVCSPRVLAWTANDPPVYVGNPTYPGNLTYPGSYMGGVTYDYNLNTFHYNSSTGTLQKYNTNNVLQWSITSVTGFGAITNFSYVFHDVNGNIYLFGRSNILLKLDSAGNRITHFIIAISANDISFDSVGNIYAIQHTIQTVYKYSSTGTLIRTWSAPYTMRSIAVDPVRDYLYIGDQYYLQKYDLDGNLLKSSYDYYSGVLSHLVVIPSTGNILAGIYLASCSTIYTPEGTHGPVFGNGMPVKNYINSDASIIYSQTFYEGTRIFMQDRAVPVISVDNTPTVNYALQGNFITGVATDPLSNITSVEFQIDSTTGTWNACSPTDTGVPVVRAWASKNEKFSCVLPSLVSGNYTIYVRATDSYTNTSTPMSFSFTFVNRPIGTLVVNQGAQYTTSRDVVLALSASSNTAIQFMEVCEQADFSGCSSESYNTSKNILLSDGDGTKTVYARFSNESDVSIVISSTIILDTLAPVGAFTLLNNFGQQQYTYQTTVWVITQDYSFSTSPGDQYIYCMDASFQGCSYKQVTGGYISESTQLTSGDGIKTLYAKFKDRAGNESEVYTQTILLDTAAPTGAASINLGSPYTNTTQVTLSLLVNDGSGAGLQDIMYCNDPSFSNCNYEMYAPLKQWQLLGEDGVKTVYILLRDNAQNTSTITATIELDTSPPILYALSQFRNNALLTVLGAVFDRNPHTYSEQSSSTISSVGAVNMNWNNRDGSWVYNFPNSFRFSLYGQTYTKMFVSSKGRICFGNSSTLAGGDGTDVSCGAFIAPFWTDLGSGANSDKISIEQKADSVTVTWKDSIINHLPTHGITTVGVAQGWHADDNSWVYNLPFPFTYYGVTYTEVRVSSNGVICFDINRNCSWYPDPLNQNTQNPAIVVLGNDLRTDRSNNGAEDIYITEGADVVTFRWQGETYSQGAPVDVELELSRDGKISFRYGSNPTPLRYYAIVGLTDGSGTAYTESRHNVQTDYSQVENVYYLYQGGVYNEYIVPGTDETIHITTRATLYQNGDVRMGWDMPYNARTVSTLLPPFVGISKGDGTTFLTSSLSGLDFVISGNSSTFFTMAEGSAVQNANISLDSGVHLPCVLSNGSSSGAYTEFSCTVTIPNGNHNVSIYANDKAGNASVLDLGTYTQAVAAPRVKPVEFQVEPVEEVKVVENEVTDPIEDIDTQGSELLTYTYVLRGANNEPLRDTVIVLFGTEQKTDSQGRIQVKQKLPGDQIAIRVNGQEIAAKVLGDSLVIVDVQQKEPFVLMRMFPWLVFAFVLVVVYRWSIRRNTG